MAAATKSLSFAITASTIHESSYVTVRRYSTLDHLTKGRIGWNIVTSYLDSTAKAFGLDEQISQDERYERAEEYSEVVYKLLEGSWKGDSLIRNAASGQYSLSEKVRVIEHDGINFKCNAAHQLHPSTQRTPFIPQAGASSAADVIKFLAGILVIFGETVGKAQEKYQNYLQCADLEGTAVLFCGWTNHDLSEYGEDEDFKFTGSGAIQSMVDTWYVSIPGTDGVKWTRQRVLQELAVGGAHPRAIGFPRTVTDILQKWIDIAGIYGFNLPFAISPGGFADIMQYLWPEPRRVLG